MFSSTGAQGLRHRMVVTAVVLAVAIGGFALGIQGWRSRVPEDEALASIVQAAALVRRGEIPQRATWTGLGSYFPPGVVWLTAPGVMVFDDLRLVELVGSAALYAGGIAGVFLIGRRYFGEPAAILAAGTYAFSAIPLNRASDLLARGHPFFYIWIVYLAGRWIDRRDARYLAGAFLVWTIGMYVHMELAPALLILPALWWWYRPPVSWPSLGAACAVAFVLWSPYLVFQWERGFIDTVSQLTMRPLETPEAPDPELSWCGPPSTIPGRLPPISADAMTPAALAGRASTYLLTRPTAVADLAMANLETRVLAGDFFLLALLGAALVATGSTAAPQRDRAGQSLDRAMLVAVALLAISILATEFVLRWVAADDSSLAASLLMVRRLHAWLVAGVVVMLARNRRVRALAADLRQAWPHPTDSLLLVLALAASWIPLLLAAEPDRSDRLSGVWPLQVLLMAGFVSAVWARTPAAQVRRWALPAIVVAVIGANLTAVTAVREWSSEGWSGADADLAMVIKYAQGCDDDR